MGTDKSHQSGNNLVAFIMKKLNRKKDIGMEVERYTDKNGKLWVRIKFLDKYKTEVVLSDSEFEKRYGKVEQYVA